MKQMPQITNGATLSWADIAALAKQFKTPLDTLIDPALLEGKTRHGFRRPSRQQMTTKT